MKVGEKRVVNHMLRNKSSFKMAGTALFGCCRREDGCRSSGSQTPYFQTAY